MPRHEDVLVLEDKWETYQRLRGQDGIRVPDTVLVRSRADLEDIFRRHPLVWLRCCSGSGGKGSISTDNIDFACLWIERHQGWGDFTAAQCLTRKSSTWSAVWHDGEVVACQSRDRLFWAYGATSPTGITGITGAQVTCNRMDLHDMAIAAIEKVVSRPEGIIGVDFTYDVDGLPYITEIQASRFYTSIHFLARAGLNLPTTFVDLALGRPVVGDARRHNALPEGLLWLKQVECEPICTSLDALPEFYNTLEDIA